MLFIKPVETEADWKDFIDFPWSIYEGNSHWVPPLKVAVRDLLNVNKNPFFKHAYMHPLMAYREGRPVGRILGCIDDRHNQFHQELTAGWGFFECINDLEVASKLFNEVANWARSRGMKTLRGPLNPSTNHECGLLIEGFEDSPSVMMTYNPPYYKNLIDECGFEKSKDLYAYEISVDSKFSERLIGHSERLKKKAQLTFRHINMRQYDEEVSRLLEVYNDAWERNWGFVPMDEEEFRQMAKEMKMICEPRFILIAEFGGSPIGFSLTLPDVNQAIRKIPDGKLFPFGLLKLLWNLKGPGRKKTIDRVRILTLGIKKAYRELGIGPIFYTEHIRLARELGYRSGEASWILEDNVPMNKALELMGARRTKVYRLFDRSL